MSEPLTIIMTHENADLDAISALVGAAKLYPHAVPVLPRRINRNAQHFLTLYGANLPSVPPEDLNLVSHRIKIEHVILVDTQSMVTIKGMIPNPDVQIIDHHPLSRKLGPNWSFTTHQVGAVTSVLVEQMAEQQCVLSPIEATLFLLGIYEDTGSLSYLTTTPRDVQCVAWLLEHGASLEIAQDFLHYPLTADQRELYELLLEKATNHTFAGHSVLVAATVFPRYVNEVSVLAHNLRDLFEPAGLFLIVQFKDQVQLIARSTSKAIDVAAIATAFGGGGHSRASAALIRNQSLAEVRQRLIELLGASVRSVNTVRQLMSFGVRTVDPSTTVSQADALMKLYGHEGFPVLQEERVVGVLSRREIDRAMRLGLDNAAIEMYMTKGKIAVQVDDPVESVQNAMISFGVGQVPVVSKQGRVLGIVTRTDLINHLFAEQNGPSQDRRPEISKKLEQAVSPARLALLWQATDCAHELGYKLYIVGGFVRDLLLDRPNLDIDLVVEGDAILLAKKLVQENQGRVRSHARFGTAKWILDDGESLDFVTARTEFYTHPTALPRVERSSIKQDLHRRDFTINTLAIRLDSNHYGELFDFYGGEQDLRAGVIRVLHSLSFVEDPTRILRAVRLEQRLGFRIESHTQELIAGALPLLARVSGERIRHELYSLFRENKPEAGLSRMSALEILSQIHPALVCDGWVQDKFRTVREVMDMWYESSWQPVVIQEDHDALHGMALPQDNSAQLYLALLSWRLMDAELETLLMRLRLNRDDADLVRQVAKLRQAATSLQTKEMLPSEVYALLEPFDGPAILIAWIAADSPHVRDLVQAYWQTYRHIRPILMGRDLKEMGLKPGPTYGHILRILRNAHLDGQIQTRAQECDMVRKLVEQGLI